MVKPPRRSQRESPEFLGTERSDLERQRAMGPLIDPTGFGHGHAPAITLGLAPGAKFNFTAPEPPPRPKNADIAVWKSTKQRHIEGLAFGRLSTEERDKALGLAERFDQSFAHFLDEASHLIVSAIQGNRSHLTLEREKRLVKEAGESAAGNIAMAMYYVREENLLAALDPLKRDSVALILRYAKILSSIHEAFIDKAISLIDISALSESEKLDLLIDFTLRHAGVGAHEFARSLFPASSINKATAKLSIGDEPSLEIQLPERAPALWTTDKQPGETPPVFIQRHYEPWLGKGLARPDIKRLDPQLYVALANWLRNNEMPADLDLPTLKEKNDRWVERVSDGGDLAPEAREMLRVSSVIRARQRQGK